MSDPSTAVERYSEPRALAVLGEREMRSIEFQARTIAFLDNRLKDDKERDEKAVALAITLHSLHLPITVTNAKKLHLINGEVMESAQLLVGLLERQGHEIRVIEDGDDRAVVRGWRHGRGEPHEVVYTIEQAKRSGALDEWVERWANAQSGKRYLAEKIVLRVDGEPVPRDTPLPEWVEKAGEVGKVKRNEAWTRYRSDMLVNRAIRRLAKRMGGDALLGVGLVDAEELGDRLDPPAPRPVEVDDREPDEDVVDADVVEPEPASAEEPAHAADPETGELPLDDTRPFTDD